MYFTAGQIVTLLVLAYCCAVSFAVHLYDKWARDDSFTSIMKYRLGKLKFYMLLWAVVFVCLIPALCHAISKAVENPDSGEDE
jgi:hypothetical protein